MAAASATAAVTGALLPHALLSHRSAPPQVLAVASSFRRLSLYASPRRTTHVVASAEAGEPEPESEAESVTASADAEEGETEGAVAVAELGEEAADEPPPPSKPAVKFGEIIGVSISSAGFSFKVCSIQHWMIGSG
jgi:large subunit ribosomal protein L19